MKKDIAWKVFFSDDERYADLINGAGCRGEQIVQKEDLQELDTQTGIAHDLVIAGEKKHSKPNRRLKNRDMLRKVAFGVNFAIIGIENQEEIDYALPVRNLIYDSGAYDKQMAEIRKKVRTDRRGLKPGEYLYGFRKDSRLHPVITFVIYYGEEDWDGATDLYGVLDFTGIPESLRGLVSNYRVNLIDVRKLTDTSVFRTDVRQVFDFIRYSKDAQALHKLVENDRYYQEMPEEAYDVVSYYTRTRELVQVKDDYRKEGKMDMCKAITDLIQGGREEGIQIGMERGIERGMERGIAQGQEQKQTIIVRNMLKRNMPVEDICALAECTEEFVEKCRTERR